MYKLELDLPIPAHLPTHLVFTQTAEGATSVLVHTSTQPEESGICSIPDIENAHFVPLDLNRRSHLLIAILLKKNQQSRCDNPDSDDLSMLFESIFSKGRKSNT